MSMTTNDNSGYYYNGESYQSRALLLNITGKLSELSENQLKELMMSCQNEIERKKRFKHAMNNNSYTG